jgi:hypothetical protein
LHNCASQRTLAQLRKSEDTCTTAQVRGHLHNAISFSQIWLVVCLSVERQSDELTDLQPPLNSLGHEKFQKAFFQDFQLGGVTEKQGVQAKLGPQSQGCSGGC